MPVESDGWYAGPSPAGPRCIASTAFSCAQIPGRIMSAGKRAEAASQWVRKSSAVKLREKKHVHSYVEDSPSSMAVVLAVLAEGDCFERWSGMPDFADYFKGTEPPSSDKACEDAKMEKSFPRLTMFLTATPVVNGKRRRTATLNVVYEDGQCKMGLRERDRNLSLWVSAEGMGEALQALEDALGDSPVRWRKVSEDYSRGRK